MHNNYYFLKHLSVALEHKIINGVVSECFSQNKDELIIRFETEAGTYFLKAELQSSFSCLSFPKDYNRARKNSIDLFQDIIGRQVQSIRQYKNERAFTIIFNEHYSLLFKMHGNKANIVLFQKETVLQLFKNSLKRDLTITINNLDRDIDWSYDNFLSHQDELHKVYFTWGKIVWQYLDEQSFQNKPIEEKWKLIEHVTALLEKGEFYIVEYKGLPLLTLLPSDSFTHTSKDSIEIANVFSSLYNVTFAFEKEKREALTYLNTKISHAKNYLDKTSQKLNEIQNDTHYKVWADLIMANLHSISMGVASVKLTNFYSGKEEEIKLKADLSPQKNAAVFYKKGKNQAIEIEFLEQSIKSKSEELQRLTETLNQVENTSEAKSLRSLIKDKNINKTLKEEIQIHPFHEFEYKGFRILVGKNAVNNDLLTLKHSYKEDLWLHAKDVAGSHVVIKYQSGKKFPKDVIERAAQLAAYNSKRKTESLCPVIFTPKKFVRKRKGDPAGAMVVEKEEVIMVEPKL